MFGTYIHVYFLKILIFACTKSVCSCIIVNQCTCITWILIFQRDTCKNCIVAIKYYYTVPFLALGVLKNVGFFLIGIIACRITF